MPDRILTTHVGSLPRPDHLVEANRERSEGRATNDQTFEVELAEAVGDVVSRQQGVGIDLVNDGEYGHSMGTRYNYGAWWTYSFERLSGLELVPVSAVQHQSPATAGTLRLASFADRRDRQQFAEAYADPESGCASPHRPNVMPVCRGPISYRVQQMIARDIAHLKATLDSEQLEGAFLNSIAPGTFARFDNEYYASDEEFVYAAADALREEYAAIIDAGLTLQIDDPALAESWDQINPAPTVEQYKRFSMLRVEALNHALRDLPSDRIRFHLCWGSWHGPHVSDLPMRDIVEVMLAVTAGAYSFEAANVRHEHEWKVWNSLALPEGKVLLPGVVSHSTNVVEHPELVADRIARFANGVGRERVIASTDCGLGGRVHPQLAWAKLRSLTEGAALASELLWRPRTRAF
jgi:5-methyltetrahydropteroyltriglutamate--homocysteine methyltransferase